MAIPPPRRIVRSARIPPWPSISESAPMPSTDPQIRNVVDLDSVIWKASEDELLGGVSAYQVAVVFTAPDGRRRWAPVIRSGLARMGQVELRDLLREAKPVTNQNRL